MKTMFIGVIIVAIIALIALVAVVMMNESNKEIIQQQEARLNQLERQVLLENAVEYCSLNVGLPINEDSIEYTRNCMTQAFEQYGTVEQLRGWNESMRQFDLDQLENEKIMANWEIACRTQNMGDVSAIENCIDSMRYRLGQ